MDYDYLFRLSVGEVELTDDKLSEIREAYEEILEQYKGWFPVFGKVGRGGNNGYNSGDSNKLKEYIVKLTSLFPEITFYLYHFYGDMDSLDIYSIKDKKMKQIFSEHLESIDTGIGKMFTMFDKDCYVSGEILND